jgi:acylphosphatase
MSLVESCVCGAKIAVTEATIAKRFLVAGEVQGVGYRYFAQRVAMRLGIRGYAKNLNDGRVEVYAIGSAMTLAEYRVELARGPRAAEVSSVDEEDRAVDARHGERFAIETDW